MSPKQIADSLVAPGRAEFRIDEIAKRWRCSVAHFWNLIKDGEIKVPAENINRARSRSCILVPRGAIVDFIRRRLSPAFLNGKQPKRNRGNCAK
jgi:hypothetical protein